MSAFTDQIAADIAGVFLNPEDFAVPITITRAQTTASTNAVVSSSVFEVTTEFGFTSVETRDYLIDPSAYDFGSGPVMPARGDQITEGGLNYIATCPVKGQDCYSLDVDRRLLTVHTVKK